MIEVLFSLRMKMPLKLILISFLTISSTGFTQGDWQDNYPKIDFSKLLDMAESTLGEDAKECENICYNYYGLFDMKYKVEFRYMDSISSENTVKKKFIDNWMKTYQSSAKNEMFLREILFTYKGTNYWFLVQEPTLPYYAEELDKGDAVFLYLLFVGTFVVDNEIEYVFVANDFEKK